MGKTVTLLFAMLVGILCSAARAADASLTVQDEMVPRWLLLDGTVEAINKGTIAAQTSGRVVRMLVDVNDQVEAGAPLIEISGNEQSASVNGAQAQLAQAQAQEKEADRQLARYQALSVKGVITRAQLDNAQATAQAARARVKASEAELTKAREAYGYTRVLAPYAGIVTARHVELGETVAPGTPLLSGLSLDALRVEAQLPQSAMSRASLTASQVRVLLPSGDEVQPTSLTRFNYADSTSHTFHLRLTLPAKQAGVLPGMWVKAKILLGERRALLIPATALLRQGELSAVYLAQGNDWSLVPVRVGDSTGDRVEILAGLQAGDRIAIDAWSRVREVHHEQ
ncbi:RND family efflux transporter, MFP subunit [Aeromonas sp. RU39B]|nr:RND family efflux transporter, MFP subunit [Aeromonas sp. RU39B]